MARRKQQQTEPQPEPMVMADVPVSQEYRDTLRTWAQYAQETNTDRASYDNAVDAARYARDQAYEQARREHSEAVSQADKQFDEAATAAWKTYFSNTDTARRLRDETIDRIRNYNSKQELQHATDMAAQHLAADDGGYEVFGDVMQYTGDEPLRRCHRCDTANHEDVWEEDVCPNCGQYVPEAKSPETPAAPDDRAGDAGDEDSAGSSGAAE